MTNRKLDPPIPTPRALVFIAVAVLAVIILPVTVGGGW